MRGAYGGALVAEDGARELVEVAERVETAALAELGAVEPHAIGGEVLDLDGIVGNCNPGVERGYARVVDPERTIPAANSEFRGRIVYDELDRGVRLGEQAAVHDWSGRRRFISRRNFLLRRG